MEYGARTMFGLGALAGLLLAHRFYDSRRPSFLDRLLRFIQASPGRRLHAISKGMGANRGTTKYYLRILEKEKGVVVLRRKSAPAQYFPASTKPADLPLLSVLARGRVLDVARSIVDAPGKPQVEIIETIHMSRRVFRMYANLLMGTQLVQEVRAPHSCRYYPSPRLAELVAQFGDDARPQRGSRP